MAFRDSTTASGNGTNLSVAVPAGVQSGDIVVLAISWDGTTGTVVGSEPAGFTLFSEVDVLFDGQNCATLWKRLTGADSGTYDFSTPGLSDWVVQAFAFSGRHATDPPVASMASNDSGNTSPVTVSATGVTAVDGDDLLWVGMSDANNASITITWAPPSTYTEREDSQNAWTSTSGATKENVSAGATGTVSGTLTLSANQSGWAAFLVRIPLAAAGGPPGGFRLLEDGVSKRLMEDVSGFRILEETVSTDTFPAGYGNHWQNTLIRM